MNESAGGDLTNVLDDDLRSTNPGTLEGADESDEELPRRAVREGLPRTFRMRHDAHYVDELMGRPADVKTPPSEAPARRAADVQTPAPAAPAASPLHISTSALSMVATRLESAVAHLSALRAQPSSSPLMAQSLQVEIARIARLSRAGAVLADQEPPLRRALLARDIADAAARASIPVARLSAIDCEVTLDDYSFAVAAEAPLVVQAIAGTIDAVVDLLVADPRRQPALDARHPGARIVVNLQCVTVRPAVIVDVICPSLSMNAAEAERFFDNDPRQYAAQPAAGILLAAAAHIVRAHGGRADVKRHNGIGATVTYVFPSDARDATVRREG